METTLNKNSGWRLFIQTILGRAYPRVVGMAREKSWLFFDIFLPMLSVSSYVFVYRAIGAPEEYVGFVQAFSEPVIRAGLEPTSSPEAISAIYERAKERLAAAPRNYPFHYLQVALLLARR